MSETKLPENALQYALMLKLPPQTIQRLKEIQREFSMQFNFPNARVSYPHITLAHWEMDPAREHKIFPRLDIQLQEAAPQMIRLNGFEQLKGAYCVKLENAEEISEAIFRKKIFLRKRLKVEALATEIGFTSRLHITIASKLTTSQLKTVGEEWQPRLFRHEFTASTAVLIKYLKEGGTKMVREFSFSGTASQQEGVGVQTSLF